MTNNKWEISELDFFFFVVWDFLRCKTHGWVYLSQVWFVHSVTNTCMDGPSKFAFHSNARACVISCTLNWQFWPLWLYPYFWVFGFSQYSQLETFKDHGGSTRYKSNPEARTCITWLTGWIEWTSLTLWIIVVLTTNP